MTPADSRNKSPAHFMHAQETVFLYFLVI